MTYCLQTHTFHYDFQRELYKLQRSAGKVVDINPVPLNQTVRKYDFSNKKHRDVYPVIHNMKTNSVSADFYIFIFFFLKSKSPFLILSGMILVEWQFPLKLLGLLYVKHNNDTADSRHSGALERSLLTIRNTSDIYQYPFNMQ